MFIYIRASVHCHVLEPFDFTVALQEQLMKLHQKENIQGGRRRVTGEVVIADSNMRPWTLLWQDFNSAGLSYRLSRPFSVRIWAFLVKTQPRTL